MGKIKTCFVLLMSLFSVLVFGQEMVTVSGTVTDSSNGEPVPFASIQLKGTMTGGNTDSEGRYSIRIPADGVLVFSSIGYQTVEAAPGGAATFDVTLSPDSEMLEETIVVAYGTTTRSSFTGSASTVNNERLEERVVSNVTNALAGQMSGVQVISSDNKPGSDAAVRIRGIGSMSASNTPLYVVDGMPYDGNISSINPADIESMTVLKDAAANAIYGARGANGVILITTKKGKTGEAKVTVDAKWGSNRRAVPNRLMPAPLRPSHTTMRTVSCWMQTTEASATLSIPSLTGNASSAPISNSIRMPFSATATGNTIIPRTTGMTRFSARVTSDRSTM